jgi:histidine decarboxylase
MLFKSLNKIIQKLKICLFFKLLSIYRDNLEKNWGRLTMSKIMADKLKTFLGQVKLRTDNHAGYPFNLSYDYTPLSKFLNYTLINLGDPFVDSNCKIDTRKFEKEVLDFFAQLYKVPEQDRWGYVTSGGTEGNLYGMFIGREIYPEGILYFSKDTHYSIPKAAKLFRIDSRVIDSQANGEIDYDKFEKTLLANKNKPAIVNVNIGTTMKGAIDNLDRILEIFQRNNIKDFYIHCDAALSGMMLPYLEGAPQIDFTKPIGSLSISGHKFLGSPMPCGVVITKKEFVKKVENTIEYIGSKDTTILGSRNGHGPLFFWYGLNTRGEKGLAQEAKRCIENSQYLTQKLQELGCKCLLNEFSNTVYFQKPPAEMVEKWQLAVQGDWAHIVVMQNMNRRKIDNFINELKTSKAPAIDKFEIARFSFVPLLKTA